MVALQTLPQWVTPIRRLKRYRCWVLLVLLYTIITPPAICKAVTPNILFILVDDLAWSDLGSYNHPWHETPHIDNLAAEGMRFTQAYAPAPICSASRASILTGKTTARLGFEFVVKSEPGEQVISPPQSLKAPPFTLALDLNETTIAEILGPGGYETAYFGKWHLNQHYKGVYNGWSPTEGPGQQGFFVAEEDFGSHPYSRKELAIIEERGRYHSDGLTEKAIGFLERKHEHPFFLMVSHFYVHTPIRTPYAWLRDKYDKKIPQGVVRRVQRIEYAAFLETLDHYVGQLLDTLKSKELDQNTLIVFLSDNGGHPEFVSNKPLRGSKWNLYEGGIRVPMLAKWPGVVGAGSVCHTPVIGYDLYPTFIEVGGMNNVSHESDGVSLVPLLKKESMSSDRPLYWHFPYYHPEGNKFGAAQGVIGIDDFSVSKTRPQSAIRVGDRKLIYFEEDQRVELYDLGQDVSEQKDLSRLEPEATRLLKKSLLDYLKSVDARRATPLF